jgi:tRNA pseudouridine38-40 synthase
VEYDGRRYHGFQWQNGLATIQAELELAVYKLTGEKIRVIGASRTDAGVHARGQVVSFQTTSLLPPQTIVRALNYYLPADIVVCSACKVKDSIDVRRNAISREYEYVLLNSPVRSPLAEGFAYQVSGKLNIRKMNKVCALLKGKHDFASFAAALKPYKRTVRTVYEAKFIRNKNRVIFHIVADSFLPHQVRNTVGLLIRIGLGKVGSDEFIHIMEAKKLGLAGPAAPPYGLYLMKVNYPADLELCYENVCN